jgi:hypothetical protein
MTNQDVITAFDVIIAMNQLEKVEGTTNIYVDPSGVRFYLDRYGFHTTLQQSNITLMTENRKLLQIYESIAGKVVHKQILGKKTRNNIRHIMASVQLSNEQKLSAIQSIVDKVESIEIRLKDQLIYMLSKYTK